MTANIPAPYVFTDRYEDQTIIWGDIPCLGLLPHLGLFETFNGKWNPDYLEYMKYCLRAAEKSGGIVTSAAWEASVYQNRMDVFNHMQYSWEHDRDFFIRNAVEGAYNPRGYFNIRSGKHRITYMLLKGSRYIPLRIKKEDYERWSGRKKADRIANFLWENHMESLPLVLLNPYFYDYASHSSGFYEKILFSLITGLCREQFRSTQKICFRGKKVLFKSTPLALYADVFHMLGFRVYIYESDSIQMGLNESVLCGTAFERLRDLGKGPERYDVAILEEEECERNISAHLTVTINGEVRSGQKIVACGFVGDELRYAFASTD